MKRRTLLAGAAMLPLGLSVQAQEAYPSRPIAMIVPFPPGGVADITGRPTAHVMGKLLKQSVVVQNKGGAGGSVGTAQAARSAPDGYTVFITTNTTHAAAEHLYKKLPYDPVKDFAPITGLGKGGQIMVVSSQSPIKSVQEFIAAAKKDPGKITFGSGSSSSRMAGELLQQLAGIELLHVPYKSNTFAVTDLLGGQIQMMITDSATGLPHVNSGKLRALGVSTRSRSPLAPNVPTIEEAGVKGYDMGYWFAAYAPAGTPQPVIDKLNALFKKAVKNPTAATFYTNSGTDIFLTTPQELAKFQNSESAKWGEIVQKAGIQKE